MAAWTAVARRIRIAPPQKPVSMAHRRGLAGDHHGDPNKVNFWEDPFNPSRWRGEPFVIVSVTGWGLVLYGAYQFFTQANNKDKEKVGDGAR